MKMIISHYVSKKANESGRGSSSFHNQVVCCFDSIFFLSLSLCHWSLVGFYSLLVKSRIINSQASDCDISPLAQ